MAMTAKTMTRLAKGLADAVPKPPISSLLCQDAPIGLFDSGVGGLSVYKHLAKVLPNERFIYFADTQNVPYGNRDSADIEALTLKAVDWLCQQGCKLIVIACNSASAYALPAARLRYPNLPIVGLVPALKPAVFASKSRHVAVLATKATLNGTLLNQVIDEIATPNKILVTKHFDPNLVPWVESGMPSNAKTAADLRYQLGCFADQNVDQLVLGCTHYPFFKEFLREEIDKNQLNLQIVDSGQAIAARVQSLLAAKNLLARAPNQSAPAALQFYASRPHPAMKPIVQRLIGSALAIEPIG